MKLKSITIGGFKNIERTRIELGRVTALISPNNFGKSNFFQGMEFALAFMDTGERSRLQLGSWQEAFPLIPGTQGSPFMFEVEAHDPDLEEYQYFRYGFSFNWSMDEKPRIVDEWLDMRQTESVKYTKFLKRDEGAYRKAKETNAFRQMILGDLQLALDSLSTIDDLAYGKVIGYLKHLSIASNSGLKHAIGSVEAIVPHSALSLSKEISDRLSALSQANPEKFGMYRRLVVALFPEIKDLEIRSASFEHGSKYRQGYHLDDDERYPSEVSEAPPVKWQNNIYKVFLKDSRFDMPVGLSMLSYGTQRILWMLTFLFDEKPEAQLIILEDIEACLHPRLFKRILELCNEQLGDACLLFSSYSPNLVEYVDLENVYIGVPSKYGVADFKAISKMKAKALLKVAQSHGLSASGYLFSLLEGDVKSNAILERYLQVSQPNTETVAALREAERLIRDPKAKRYNNVEDFLRELKT